MIKIRIGTIMLSFLLVGCFSKSTPQNTSLQKKTAITTYSDTLQFLEVGEGEDNVFGVFIDRQQDTVTIVWDKLQTQGKRNAMFHCEWEVKTITSGGDKSIVYNQAFMLKSKKLKIPPFVDYLTPSFVGKTYKSRIGFMSVETPEPMPCAGYMIDLVLKFNDEYVDVITENVNECGTERDTLQAYFFTKKDTVLFEPGLPYAGESLLKSDKLQIKDHQLKGIRNSNMEDEIIFEEIKNESYHKP